MMIDVAGSACIAAVQTYRSLFALFVPKCIFSCSQKKRGGRETRTQESVLHETFPKKPALVSFARKPSNNVKVEDPVDKIEQRERSGEQESGSIVYVFWPAVGHSPIVPATVNAHNIRPLSRFGLSFRFVTKYFYCRRHLQQLCILTAALFAMQVEYDCISICLLFLIT